MLLASQSPGPIVVAKLQAVIHRWRLGYLLTHSTRMLVSGWLVLLSLVHMCGPCAIVTNQPYSAYCRQ